MYVLTLCDVNASVLTGRAGKLADGTDSVILTRLILASLLADFVFQPPRLVSWKSRASAGLLVHGVIHLALTAAVDVGYWSARCLVLAATLAIAHPGGGCGEDPDGPRSL